MFFLQKYISKMKIYTLIFFLSIISFNLLSSQNLKNILFNISYELDFVGLDFSSAKFIGTANEYAETGRLKNEFIPSWNNLFYLQREKFDLGKFMHKENINNNTEYVQEINSNINEEEMFSLKSYEKFSPEKLQEIVNNYDFEYENEVGLALIVNSFDKISKIAVINVVWFNTKTLKVIKSIRRNTKPSGFGFRNYWAGSIFYAIKDLEGLLLTLAKKELEKKEYKSWAKWKKK